MSKGISLRNVHAVDCSPVSKDTRRQQGLKGPTQELIEAVVEMKRRNRTWGCKRIVQQIALGGGVEIDKEVVLRILGIHFRPETGSEVRHGFPYWSRQETHCGPVSMWVCLAILGAA